MTVTIFWQTAASLAALVFTLGYVAQIIKTLKSRDVSGLSAWQWIGFSLGSFAYLGFYANIEQWALAFLALFGLACCLAMVAMIFLFEEKDHMDFSRFDGIEVSPVRFVGVDESEVERIERDEVDGSDGVFWSVYGHLKEGHVECLEDFQSESAAMKYAKKLLNEYSNLNKHGILAY